MTGNHIIAAIIGYLLGNIQFAVLISRLKYKDDVRNHGSGNAGSTNMLRVYGIKLGAVTFVGDFLKGISAVLIGRLVAGDMGGYVASIGVVLGHSFPVFLQFKGGKGVASTFGIAWMLNPLYAVIITVLCAGVLLLTHTISIVSMCGATIFFLLTLLFDWGNTPLLVTVFALWLLIILRHTENIGRLLRGEESKVMQKKKKDESA